MVLWKDLQEKSGFYVNWVPCDTGSRILSGQLGEGEQLLDPGLLCSGRDAPALKSQLSMIPQFLIVVSQSPESVSCGGVGIEVKKTLDRAPPSMVGFQYRLDVESLKEGKPLRKPRNSGIGTIDTFALIKSLPPFLLILWI